MTKELTKREFNKRMGWLVATLRLARNWTQDEAADHMGVSLAVYKKWEGRSTPISHVLIPAFCSLHSITKDDFYDRIPTATKPPQTRVQNLRKKARPVRKRRRA